MKIKLAILEKDQNYLQRIVSVFNVKYSDKFEVYSFTDQQVAMNALEGSKIDVLIASDVFEIPVESLPKRCSFAYFVDSSDVDSINEQRAIGKFQKVDLIYKQILSIYSEKAGSITGLKLDDDSTKIVIFNSVSGGVGASSMAAAYSRRLASKGKKVLYLNLEKFGSSDVFFSGEGQFDMSDIVFAIKSKKSNLALKLESCVKQDISGVNFYSKPKIALDMLELKCDEVLRLISELKLAGSYNYIVVDADFAIDTENLEICRQAHSIVWVGDGSEISNGKIFGAYTALSIIEKNEDSPLLNRIVLVYNKFSNKTGKSVGEIGLKNIGGAPRYEHATTNQVVEQISKMDMLDKII